MVNQSLSAAERVVTQQTLHDDAAEAFCNEQSM